jgi:hypothetical protein
MWKCNAVRGRTEAEALFDSSCDTLTSNLGDI